MYGRSACSAIEGKSIGPSIRLERAPTLEPFGNTGYALINDRVDRFSLVLTSVGT